MVSAQQMKCSSVLILVIILTMLTGTVISGEPELEASRYLLSVRDFTDTGLECGHDAYGGHKMPLSVDGLHVKTFQAAENLLARGGKYAEVGQEFTKWASEDLKVLAEHCYEQKEGHLIVKLTDGTPLKWQQAKQDDPRTNSSQLFYEDVRPFRVFFAS